MNTIADFREKVKKLNSDIYNLETKQNNLIAENSKLKDLVCDKQSDIRELESFKLLKLNRNSEFKNILSKEEYNDSRNKFFITNKHIKVLARRVFSTKGHFAGWVLYRGQAPIHSSRGGLTVFKGLNSVESFCSSHGIGNFDTEDF